MMARRYETKDELLRALRDKGRDLTRAQLVHAMKQAELYLPLSDADLPDLEQFLGPRRVPRRGNWRPLLEAAKAASRARFAKVRPWIEAVRQGIFGSAKAPLDTLPEVEPWILSQAPQKPSEPARESLIEVQDSAFTWKYVSGPYGDHLKLAFPGSKTGGTHRTEEKRPVLYYARGQGLGMGSTDVKEGTILDRLRLAAEGLARYLGCHSARGLVCLLVDIYPVVSPVELVWKKEGPERSDEARAEPWLQQIKINYPWVPAWAVEEAYRGKGPVQADVSWAKVTRARRQAAPLRAELQALVEATPDLSWEERLERWNRQHPEHRYVSWRSMESTYRRKSSR